MTHLIMTNKGDPYLKSLMDVHYSQPKGFVGRSLIYEIWYGKTKYGCIVAGSSTKNLPGRNDFFDGNRPHLNSIVNNTFYHIEKVGGKYPERNFTTNVLSLWRTSVIDDWKASYGDEVMAFESLVELPRTGELYRRDGWTEVGTTKGFTCKRTGGKGTDSWGGKRVWDKVNLRPKRVFCRLTDNYVATEPLQLAA